MPRPDATTTAILKTPKKRFGNASRAERYRALATSLLSSLSSTRRRQLGETIQAMYTDLRRLLSLAFPGQWEICSSKLTAIIFCPHWMTLRCKFASVINNQNLLTNVW